MAKPRTQITVDEIARFVARDHSQSTANCRVLLDAIAQLRQQLGNLADQPDSGEIYIITVMTRPRSKVAVRRTDGELVRYESRDTRSWGWYPTLAEAERALDANLTDMHETQYDVAVIERQPPGICAGATEESWWIFDPAANEALGGYVRGAKPEDLAQIVQFGMA